jgi:hypothetical protein
MAGLKKKKQDKSGSPNVVLVIFIIFFFLLSIGLGIWGYYGYAGQDKLETQRKTAEAEKKVEKLGKEYYSMLYRDLRTHVGDTLDQTEEEELKAHKDAFLSDGFGKFKDEKTKDAAFKLMMELKNKDYEKLRENPGFPKELKIAHEKQREAEAKVAGAVAKAGSVDDYIKSHTASQDKFQGEVNKRIADDNAAQTLLVQKASDNVKKLTDSNKELIDSLTAKDKEVLDLKEDHEKEVKKFKREVARLEAEKAEMLGGGTGKDKDKGGPAVTLRGSDAFPLLLDISPGKPLWDNPVGKITRVDLDLRQVAINLGHAQGAKPELTFNIFSAGTNGRAEGKLKGSIEIIKVIDANTSLCRITSLFDAEGMEILLNLQTRNRVLRETEAPLKEGDLLFNLFWGTRVAVAGYCSITGDPSDNPAEQVRQMNDLMYLLKRNGIQVDAYVDLRDGHVEGKITSKTRYLIRGDELRSTEPKAAPKTDEEKDKEKDMPKEAAPNTDRNDLVNKSSRTLRETARERGLLSISAENFATVTGYRRARSGNSAELSNFRPSLPVAGPPNAGVLVMPERPAPPPAEEKKEEKKDM